MARGEGGGGGTGSLGGAVTGEDGDAGSCADGGGDCSGGPGGGQLPRCNLGEEGEICGSSNPPGSYLQLPPAASTVALLMAPESSRWTTPAASYSLDDEVWSVRLEFEGSEHMVMNIGKSDITLHLLNLIERKGYGIRDSMYCLLVDTNGVPGYELLDGMGKVLQMLGIYEQKHAVTVIVMKGKNKPTSSMISAIAVENSYSLYDDELSYLGSRQNICVEENKADCLSNSDEDLFAQDYDTQLREEKIELSQKLIEMKKRRQQPDEHIEGDTDVDDLFCHSDSDDDGSCFIQMVLPEDEPMQEKRRKLTPVRKGPTERAHCSSHISEPACYVPSSDSGSDGDLREEDDDGAAMSRASA
nr:uncharacterized protein LOC127347089 [Lolium perenne]